MKNLNVFLLVFILCLLSSANVLASTFEGVIKEVQINPGSTPVRLSIFVGPHGSACTAFNGNWFAYENGDTGIGKIWTSAILAAYSTGKTILISGSGACDDFGVESVSYIHLK